MYRFKSLNLENVRLISSCIEEENRLDAMFSNFYLVINHTSLIISRSLKFMVVKEVKI